jgi:hypothetical protein
MEITFAALAPPKSPVVPRVKRAWSDEILLRDGAAELGRLFREDALILATEGTAEPGLFMRKTPPFIP